MMRSNKIHIKQSSPDARFEPKADMTPAEELVVGLKGNIAEH
jgi:hypothetical protein